MSQSTESTESTMSTTISIPQWNAIEIFNIHRKPDGTFTCATVRNRNSTPCRYRLRGKTASNINELLNSMSSSPPQSAIRSLENLANKALCPSHRLQAPVKVTEWTAAINRLPLTRAGPNNLGDYPPSPLSGSVLTSQSTLSLSPSNNDSTSILGVSSRLQQHDDTTLTPIISDGPVEDEVRLLRIEIKLLTDRIAALEIQRGDTLAPASSHAVANPPSLRPGLRARVFGRSNS